MLFQAASAAPDPLIKHVEKKEADEVFKSTSEEVDKLPIEERVAESVTPFAKMPYEEQVINLSWHGTKLVNEANRGVLFKIRL